mmetsp:Transcript_36960/g.35672  ORF Transcript_36960/g.35672 Transcript_36960/m.35672 type:complete len:123 (-) Transcript_36960:18-386(-)
MIFKYSYGIRCEEIVVGEKNQIEYIKKNHQKVEEVRGEGDQIIAHIFIGFLSEHYFFILQNNAKKKITLTLKLQVDGNLKMVEGKGNEWKVELLPNACALRKVQRLNPVKEAHFQYSYCVAM